MSFYGSTFVFDSIPSEMYNLQILYFDSSSGYTESPAGNDIQIFEKRTYTDPQSFHFGNSQSEPLEFDLTCGSIEPLNGLDRGAIKRWVMGRGKYIKLQIIQDDISDAYYNVICTGATDLYIGNVYYGIKLHFVCDAPWGYTFPRTLSYVFSGDEIQNFTLDFYNSSQNRELLYPIVEFTLNSIGSSFTIINYTDDSNEFTFTDISPGETITVDNRLKTIKSSTGLRRLGNFNKNWLKFKTGNNELRIISGIGTVNITYSFARTIGG